MEENFFEEVKKPKTDTPIYSKLVVLSFSIFVNPVFGGFMLRQNLIDINEKKAANLALMASFIVFFLTGIINLTSIAGFGVIFASNLIGGAIIAEYFYGKYFQEEFKYPKKSLQKPLRIALLLTFILFLLLTLFSNQLSTQLPK